MLIRQDAINKVIRTMEAVPEDERCPSFRQVLRKIGEARDGELVNRAKYVKKSGVMNCVV